MEIALKKLWEMKNGPVVNKRCSTISLQQVITRSLASLCSANKTWNNKNSCERNQTKSWYINSFNFSHQGQRSDFHLLKQTVGNIPLYLLLSCVYMAGEKRHKLPILYIYIVTKVWTRWFCVFCIMYSCINIIHRVFVGCLYWFCNVSVAFPSLPLQYHGLVWQRESLRDTEILTFDLHRMSSFTRWWNAFIFRASFTLIYVNKWSEINMTWTILEWMILSYRQSPTETHVHEILATESKGKTGWPWLRTSIHLLKSEECLFCVDH